MPAKKKLTRILVPRQTFLVDGDLYHYPNTLYSQESIGKRLSQENKGKITQAQRRTLEKIRKTKALKSDRGVKKAERAKYARSALGVEARRVIIKKALGVIGTWKRQEIRKRVKGRRLSKKVTAEDVQKWFWVEKKVKFCTKTIYDDLRTLRRPQ